jgi:hypothetical protein
MQNLMTTKNAPESSQNPIQEPYLKCVIDPPPAIEEPPSNVEDIQYEERSPTSIEQQRILLKHYWTTDEVWL